MSLTAKDVAEIVRLLEESSFDELELESGDLKLSLRRGADGSVAPSTASRSPSPVARGRTKTSEPVASRPPPPAGEVARRAGGGDPNAVDVPSPLLGIFYRAPKPGEAPFIEIGAKVEEETVIGIIEVMKLMNSVRAGVRGEVTEILAENAGLVEYGEALIRVRPAA